MEVTTLARWTVYAAAMLAASGSSDWEAPIRKAFLDTNKDGHIQQEECKCNAESHTNSASTIPRASVDYASLVSYEAIAASIASTVSAMNGTIDPREEISILSDILYQDPRFIMRAWLCYTPDSYGTAFSKSYDMTKSAKLLSRKDCGYTGTCNSTDLHVQENLTVRFFPQIGGNATLHCPLISANRCCPPVSYGDYLDTFELAWTYNYFSPDIRFRKFTLPISGYLNGKKNWLGAGTWSDPFMDPDFGVLASFGVPVVTTTPLLGSIDPFSGPPAQTGNGFANPGFMKSFEGLYVMGVAGVDVSLREIGLVCEAGYYKTYPICSLCPLGKYRMALAKEDNCSLCDPGTFTNVEGSTACRSCRKGFSQSLVGQSFCEQCVPGTVQPDRGMTECLICPEGQVYPNFEGEYCIKCIVGHYSPEPGASACMRCEPGKAQKDIGMSTCWSCAPGSVNAEWNATDCANCPLGKYAPELGMAACLGCQPGTVQKAVGMSMCFLCAPGYANSNWNATDCNICLAGQYAAESGTTVCLSCEPGRARGERGASACSLCTLGTATSEWNASDCTRCPIGQYASEHGLRACVRCPQDMTTGGPGSESADECMCPEKTFLGAISGKCEVCPSGMTCLEGSLDPLYRDFVHTPALLPGYYSSFQEPLSVYSCNDITSCPGGPPGTCGGGRVGLACQLCEAGQYGSAEGDCRHCDSAGIGPLIALFIVGVIGAAMSHSAVNFPLLKTKSVSMAGVFLAGLVVTTMLSFNIYSNLNTVWVTPLSDLFSILRVMALDLKMLKFSCFAGSSKLMPRYMFKVAAIPSAFLVVCQGAFLMKLTKWTRAYAFFTIPDLINSGGFLFSVFFIAVSLASLEGFMCIDNPNGVNTLISDRSVVCWSSQDHANLVLASSIAIIVYPLNFLVVTGYCTFRYYSLAERFGSKFTFSMRFLMSRWKPDQYYFGILYTVRNFALTIAPLIQPNNYDIQVVLLQLIYVSWLLVQLSLRPWRFNILDKFDAISSSMQIVVLTCFGLLGGNEIAESLSAQSAGYIAFGAFVLFAVVTFLAASLSLAQRFRRLKEFGLFLSHHKGADAVYARQIKLMLAMVTTRRVFLDVDNLTSLDELVFLVRSRVDNLVVLLSPETLNRFWCAVEIICAVKNRMQIILTQTHPVENLLSPEFLDLASSMWGPDQVMDFNKVGINAASDTCAAYRFVATLPIIPMLMNSPEVSQRDAVLKIIAVAKGCRMDKRAYKVESHLVSYIVYNTNCFVQASCTRILCMLMKTNRWNCSILNDNSRSPETVKSVMLAFVSQGFPMDPVGLGHACYLNQNGVPFTTIVSQEDFQKALPSKDYMDKLCEGRAFNKHQMGTLGLIAPGMRPSSIAEVVATIYACLAASFNPKDSEHILLVELSTIIKRAEQHLAGLGRQGPVKSSFLPSTSNGSTTKGPESKVDWSLPDDSERGASPAKISQIQI